MRPTGLAIALAAGGLLIALLPAAVEPRLWPLWPLFLGAFAALLGAEALLLPRRRGVTVAAEVPRTLAIGEGGTAHLTVTVPSARRLAVRVALDLSDLLVPQPAQTALGATGETGLACALKFALVPTRRGVVAVERAWVRYTGPLRLLAAVVVRELGREAEVVPNLAPVRDAALRFADDRTFRAGLKIERFAGDGSEFESLREHVQGDDPRSIDWKVTARHKKLVSRRYRAERNHQIILALDTGRLMSEPVAGIPKLDHAVTTALYLSYVSLRAGDRVGWITFDARVGSFVEPRSGVNAFGVLAQRAGRIRYASGETNFTLGLTSLAQRLTRRSLVVVLTDFVDTVTAELMVENLDRLARRHAVVFVALRDPSLASIAGRYPADLLALNRAVVAGALLRDRDVVLRRLSRQGIEPIDAAPSEVTPQLINTYLEIKRRERI
jgi:uncharacterized protein (DUF58 family)